jgi:hypothetical protein
MAERLGDTAVANSTDFNRSQRWLIFPTINTIYYHRMALCELLDGVKYNDLG